MEESDFNPSGYADDFNHSGEMDHEDDDFMENPEEVIQQCSAQLSSPDFVMEPGVLETINRYCRAGGPPEFIVDALADNYTALAQTSNLLAEWLIQAGVDIKDVQEMVENHLKDVILKHFSPKKADSIFTADGETPSWLAEMTEYPTWRNLFYQLAEQYPECLMLKFTIKLISDAGYQNEITSVSTASHQLEVFSKVIRSMILNLLENGLEGTNSNLAEFLDMVCHGEHIYLYTQTVLSILAQEPKGGNSAVRLSEEVEKAAMAKSLDVTPIIVALNGAASHPKACHAIASMLSKRALNPADITVLHKLYNAADPPPVSIMRSPQFLDLFIDLLFKPGIKINPDHKPKYIYLLGYASAVSETWRKNLRTSINKDEIKTTTAAIEKAHSVCNSNAPASEILNDIQSFFQCLKVPVVAAGVLKWIELVVSDNSYFKLNTDHTPIHLVLLDEISTNHPLLHQQVLDLLKQLFLHSFEDLDELEQLELKKTILDRIIHIFSRGCVVPVAKFIRHCYGQGDTDVSLIRYFVTEVLDIVGPPFSQEFAEVFLPLITNEDIIGELKNEEEKASLKEFLDYCKQHYPSLSL